MATKIQWTNETWNFLSGCTKISQGCENCYAEKMSRRLAAMGQKHYQGIINSEGRWNGDTHFNPDAIELPFRWKKPRIIFVNSMSDTFHASVTSITLRKMFDTIEKCPQHTFLLLTKRPDIALAASQSERLGYWFNLPNIWLGVTAENQEMANKRIPILLQIPAAKRFVSIEPQIGPVDLTSIEHKNSEGKHVCSYQVLEPIRNCGDSDRPALDWVICGSESSPRRRPFDEFWAMQLKADCVRYNVPFFFKQRYIGNKKFSMPLLDGKIWDQIPKG